MCMNIATDNLWCDMSSIIDLKLFWMYFCVVCKREEGYSYKSGNMVTVQEERGVVGSGSCDLQGLRCVECAGGDRGWQLSQTIHVCLKNSWWWEMMPVLSTVITALVLLSWPLVCVTSGNWLYATISFCAFFKYSLTIFKFEFCCFMDFLFSF